MYFNQQILEYNAGKRCGPGEYAVDPTLDRTIGNRCEAMMKDFGWFLARLPNAYDETPDSRQTVPGWSGSHPCPIHPHRLESSKSTDDSTYRKSSRKRKRILCLPEVNSWMSEGRKC